MSDQKPLAEKLREKLAFDRAIEKPLREKYRIVECDGPCDSYGVCPNCIEANEMLVGAQEENARLSPYHEAMISAVAALEKAEEFFMKHGDYPNVDANKSFEELLQGQERIAKCGCSCSDPHAKTLKAFRKFIDLTKDRLRTLGRDEDYAEIESEVMKELK